MLEDKVAEVLRPGGPLAEALAQYESRPGQWAMAARVAKAIENDERLLVEAGTGTGKTLAYLVPAILSGRKVVISTGTKTLQDQIARLDLPRLRKILPQPFSFAVMKGLGNYVCLRRLSEYATPEWENLATVRAWLEETETGDRAELADLPDDAPLWRDITATPETRLGSRCNFFERCYVTAMRRHALEAQVVLVNHHLFFADLALRTRWPEAQVIPPYEAVVFDEAHQLEEVATEFFGLHVSSARLFALARDVGRVVLGAKLATRITSLARRISGAADAFATALRARVPVPATGAGDETRVPMPDDLWAPARALDTPIARYHELDNVLEEAATLLDRLARDNGNENGAPVWAGLARRAASARDELAALVDSSRRDQVRWIATTTRNMSLRASPIEVAPLLARAFDHHIGPLVFTSATLTAGGSFSYVRDALGLGDTASEASFPSPFRWDQQALLYLAADLPNPGEERFPAAAAERALELCRASAGRALLLFTSFRNLRVAAERLRADGGFPVLVQGEKPRHTLLESLRGRLGSVLLATQSFWEGVDVPGEALELVVIDRLPFAVPDEPLVGARIARIRETDGDPFTSYQLPQAALALKQGFGRLIRTRRDRGVAAILDGRILRRPYGGVLLQSLPPGCRRTELLEDVAEFFQRRAP